MVLLNNIFKYLNYLNIINQSKIRIIFSIYLFLLTITHCYIVIPIKYYPEKVFNETNPSNTMHNLIIQRLYATIELGSPKQTIQIPIEFNTNDFYISNSYTLRNDPKYDKFQLKYFNEEASTTLKQVEEQEVYYGVNFLLASKQIDYFYFGDRKIEIEFYLSDHLEDAKPGELGLQLNPVSDLNTAFDTIEKSFLKIIKNKGLTNNYSCSILFKPTDNNNYNTKESDGLLVIGAFLHDIDDRYDYNTLTSVNAKIFQNAVTTEFSMNQLIIYRNNNPEDIIKEIDLTRSYLQVKLDYNFQGIQGSENIRPYLEANLFTKENNCYKDKFNFMDKYYFYYCENNPTIIKKIKDNFPTIQFTHQDFNHDFIINADELFIVKGQYVYCLMVFSDFYNKYGWRLGRPFLNKYIFTVDHDSKKLLFYSVKDKVNIRGLKKSTSIIIILILVFVFLIIGFILARRIYNIRTRKAANVLEDDFEYVSPEEKYKKGSKIEMTKKLFTED